MNIENGDSSTLSPGEEPSSVSVDKNNTNLVVDKTTNFIIGTVGSSNLKNIITSELSNPGKELTIITRPDIDCSLSEKLGRVEDFVKDKPDDIDNKIKPNKVKFYKSFIHVSKRSKRRIK